MSRYERAYGTDWDDLDEDEAVDRAYALGVAASLGEYHPEELEAIREEMSSAYSQSLVELAFDQGKNEGKEAEPDDRPDESAEAEVWEELIIAEPPDIDEEGSPTGGRTGLPEAIDVADVLDGQDLDRTEAIDLPEFLERE